MIRRSSTPDVLQTSLSIYQFKSALSRKYAPLAFTSAGSGVPDQLSYNQGKFHHYVYMIMLWNKIYSTINISMFRKTRFPVVMQDISTFLAWQLYCTHAVSVLEISHMLLIKIASYDITSFSIWEIWRHMNEWMNEQLYLKRVKTHHGEQYNWKTCAPRIQYIQSY
jgi:hypothetical protein